jgi:glycine hydroxymethyltransferase
MLVDLRSKGLSGKQAESLLDEIGITVNKNTIPYDTESPFVTSGIRIGTPAVTTRGMKEEAMEEIAEVIALILNDPHAKKEAAARVQRLCADYPLYGELGK